MKLEEVNTRTKEAVDFLVAALESGHSEVLTAYFGAMAKFHTYRSEDTAAAVPGSGTWYRSRGSSEDLLPSLKKQLSSRLRKKHEIRRSQHTNERGRRFPRCSVGVGSQ